MDKDTRNTIKQPLQRGWIPVSWRLRVRTAVGLVILSGSVRLANAQETLNLSQDMLKLGISSTNMAPNQQTQDAGPLVQKGLQYAQSHNLKNVIADPGAYYFLSKTSDCYVTIPTGLTMDLQGSDLNFADPSSSAVCPNGTNITLQNFTIDYLQLPWTQAVITSVDSTRNQFSFTVQPGWQKPSALNSIGLGTSPSMTIFRGGRVYNALVGIQLPLTDDNATIVDSGPYKASEEVAQIRPGDLVALEKDTFGEGIKGVCDGCTFRNIRIYAAGLGATDIFGQNDLLERVYVMPKPGTDRLLSAFHDVHITLTGPNNIIRLSRAIRKGDDGFSPISQKLGIVTQQLDSRTLQVQATPGGYFDILLTGPLLPNGSTVEFQRHSDGVILGRAVIVLQTTPQPVTGTRPTNWINLTLDRDVTSDFVDSSVYPLDPDRRGGNLLLERNTVQQQVSGSGFQLYGLVNATVKGNYVSRSAWTGVWINSNTNDAYARAIPSSGVIVSRNVIDRPNSWLSRWIDTAQFAGIQALAWLPAWTPMHVSPMQNLTINDNFVADPRRSGIWIGNTNGGVVSGNNLLNPNNDPAPQIIGFNKPSIDVSTPLAVDTSQYVTTDNNTLDQSSGRMWVTDARYRELAAYTPGSAVRLNAYNLGKLGSPSIAFTDADGVVWAANAQTATDHSIDVLVPAAAALGGAYLTLSSGDLNFGNTKYFGTLFVDSQDNVPAVNECTYELSPSSTVIPTSGSLSILVITQAGCAYTPTGADPSVTVSGSGTGTGVATVIARAATTLEIAGLPIALTQTAPLHEIGSFAQVASGGGWSTRLTLTNLSAATVSAHVSFYANDGRPLTLPLTFPNSNLPNTVSPFADISIAPNQSVVVATTSSSSAINVGWADVAASGALKGYTVFNLSSSGGPDSSGTVPLDTRLSPSVVLPYDNTNGSRSGVALANQTGTPATITALLLDQNGVQLSSSQIVLAADGHSSFFISDVFPQSANRIGLISFQNPAGNVTAVGLLFNSSGSFTSLPIIQ